MAKIDKLKEEVSSLRLFIAILAAVTISLIGWIAQNIQSTSKIMIVVCVLAILVTSLAFVWVNKRSYKKIDELEDL